MIVDASADSPPVVITKMSCPDVKYTDKYSPGYVQPKELTDKAMATLQTLSLEEKFAQMRGTQPPGYVDIFRQPDNTAKGVKGFLFRDGPRGLNLDAETNGRPGYSTAFPVAMARGAAFDMELEYLIGDAIGDETLASGHTMLLSPTVNILRHPAWGRAQEVYGEDSYLLGRLGTAFTTGLQKYVAACAKHYAANNIENGRAGDNAQMSEQTLHEVYANHFGMIVRDSGVACVMASYNLVNGTYATQNRHLLTEILRGEFKFTGFVLSDWWAMPGGSNPGGASNQQTNTTEAVSAGMDMELPQNLNFSQLSALVSAGRLTEAQINISVSRILAQKHRFNVATIGGTLGLAKPTTTYSSATNSIGNNQAHIALAQEAAIKSMVLLKNDKNTLPISRANVKTVAVLGLSLPYTLQGVTRNVDFARDARMGDLGSSRVNADPAKSVGPFAGITAAAGQGIRVVTGANAAAAAGADFIVVVAGLTPQDEGEEYTNAGDRDNFRLDNKQGNKDQQYGLIRAAAALNKPMVVVLEGGSVIDMPDDTFTQVPAVVMAWYPGQDGGTALGKLLFGDANFSGKLPISWPKTGGFGPPDEPTFHSGATTPMEYDLGYRRFDRMKGTITPKYAFGYGLSYTTFEYSNLSVPCSDVTKQGVVNVTVSVSNKGTVKGDEIVMLFVSYPMTKAMRSVKELKGFYRVSLDPGVTKNITIPLRVSDLTYYDAAAKALVVESGPVQVMVGPSADKLPLMDTFIVK